MKPDLLIEKLAADLEPVKVLQSPARRATIWILISIFSALGFIVYRGVRPDFAIVSSDVNFWLEALTGLAVTVIGITGAFYLSIPGFSHRIIRWLVFVPLSLWLVQLAVRYFVLTPEHLAPKFDWEGHFCSVLLLSSIIAPAILFLVMIKQAAPVLLGWTGAIAFVGIGALGALTLHFTCSSTAVTHVFSWHLMPIVLLLIVGIQVGRRWFRW